MSRQCPVCHQAIEPYPTCDAYQDGVCRCLDEPLQTHIQRLTTFRSQTVPHLNINGNYDALPDSMRHTHFEWRIRTEDVRITRRLLAKRAPGHVLEIGAWNGWLSHLLAKAGWRVTALGYSADADNLGAKRNYSVDWHAIQIDLTRLDQIHHRFDTVIVNHGLHLFPEPVDYLKTVQGLAKPGGLLIVLCMIFFRDPARRRRQIQQTEDAMQSAYGLPYFLRPTRGYMDMSDWHRIRSLGVRTRPYRATWKANLKSRVIKTSPAYQYGWQVL